MAALEAARPAAKQLDSTEFDVFYTVFFDFRYCVGSFCLHEARGLGHGPLDPLKSVTVWF